MIDSRLYICIIWRNSSPQNWRLFVWECCVFGSQTVIMQWRPETRINTGKLSSLHHLKIIFIRAADIVMTPFILYNWTCVWIKIFQSSFKKKLMGMSSMWSCLNKSWWCCIRWYQDDTCYSAFSPQIRGQGSQCWSVTMLHHTDHCSSLTQLIVYNDSDNSDNAVNIVITMWDHVPEWQEPVWLPSHLGHLHLPHQCLLLSPPHRGLWVSQEPGQFSKQVVHLSWLHVKPG